MMEAKEELCIRKMKPEDIEVVSSIEERIFSMPWTPDSFASALEMLGANYLVAETKEGIVGYCGYYSSFEEAEITNVAVVPETRNKGYATVMLQELIRQGKKNGITRVVLEVRCSNASAIHLYEKMGFSSVGVRKNFYERPREDAIIMVME